MAEFSDSTCVCLLTDSISKAEEKIQEIKVKLTTEKKNVSAKNSLIPQTKLLRLICQTERYSVLTSNFPRLSLFVSFFLTEFFILWFVELGFLVVVSLLVRWQKVGISCARLSFGSLTAYVFFCHI